MWRKDRRQHRDAGHRLGRLGTPPQRHHQHNEPYDIIFGNDATYNNDVRLGAYYEITEEDLNTYAPGLLELIPADYWDAVRVNGKIYAVPSYKDSSMTNYFVWDKDLLDANSIDTTEMHDLAAVEETLYALKDLVSIAPFTTNGNGNGFILANYDLPELRPAGPGRARG